MSVLDVHSGTVLSSATIGWGPIAVALDEHTERAFIVVKVSGVMRLPDTYLGLRGRLYGCRPTPPR